MGREPSSPERRGLDGLTTAELQATRQGFWDAGFSELLLRRVPEGATAIIDVGCGLATAAHALLPARPAATYVGVDADEQRLREAEKLMTGVAYAARVRLRPGNAERLPCRDNEADLALTTMTLQHLLDPAAALRELHRVLVPAGRLVAVEPDNLDNLFYFDGTLEAVNAAFQELFAQRRRERSPADGAIGPALARWIERERFSVVEFFPHMLGRTKKQTAKDFFDRVRQAATIVSAGLTAAAAALEACNGSIDAAQASIGPETTGYSCQLVPVFVCVAVKI